MHILYVYAVKKTSHGVSEVTENRDRYKHDQKMHHVENLTLLSYLILLSTSTVNIEIYRYLLSIS